MWTRKLTWPGERENDWLVLRDGKPVGRVYLTILNNPRREVWMWFKQTIPGRKGEAETMQGALEAVRAAVLADGP
jgi:hypothetical protein